jgi:hypothetical protein
MPRKRKHQPIYPTSHGHSSSSTQSANPRPQTKTVNEKLAQLRREAAPPPTIEAINRISSVAASHTQPPAIRGILGLPETAPVRPRPRPRGAGYRAQPQGTVFSTTFSETNSEVSSATITLTAPMEGLRRRPLSFSHMALSTTSSERLPKPRSLQHLVLKNLANNWSFFQEYEKYNIHLLPLNMRSSLLVYISFYGPKRGINKSTLKLLFQNDDLEHLSRLDINGLLSSEFDFVHLYRYITKVKPSTEQVNSSSADYDNSVISPETSTWEEQLQSLSLRRSPSRPFSNLTSLGLGNPGQYASWAQLLMLAPHLNNLTRLSLAYWPTPCLAPTVPPARYQVLELPPFEKLRTMPFEEVYRLVRQSTEHNFTRRTDEFKEAAQVLKTLSHHIYRLEYLDMEGCFNWLPALAWREYGRIRPLEHPALAQRTEWSIDHDQTTYCPPFEPALTEDWGSVTEINVRQGGLIPQSYISILKLPAGFVTRELLAHLYSNDVHWTPDQYDGSQQRDKGTVSKQDVDVMKWVETEKQIRFVTTRIRMLRAERKKNRIQFDHGLQTNKDELEQSGYEGVGVPPGFFDDIRDRRFNILADSSLASIRHASWAR